jgi:hypothetical protein
MAPTRRTLTWIEVDQLPPPPAGISDEVKAQLIALCEGWIPSVLEKVIANELVDVVLPAPCREIPDGLLYSANPWELANRCTSAVSKRLQM